MEEDDRHTEQQRLEEPHGDQRHIECDHRREQDHEARPMPQERTLVGVGAASSELAVRDETLGGGQQCRLVAHRIGTGLRDSADDHVEHEQRREPHVVSIWRR